MELKQRLYAFLTLDLICILASAATLILKVHYYYAIIIPVHLLLSAVNWQVLKNQSVGWLKVIQWLRIVLLLFYGIIFMVGVIMITTYHFGSWENLGIDHLFPFSFRCNIVTKC